MKLNVGCGRNIREGWVNLDWRPGPGVDVVFDLDACGLATLCTDDGAEHQIPRLPFDDNSVDEFLLSHVLEHLRHPLPLMQELHRIANADAPLVVVCPYGSSNDADEDPTHVRRIYEGSFNYFGQPYYHRADYGYRGDWRVRRMILRLEPHCPFKDGLERAARAIKTQRNQVRELIAELVPVKPIREPRAELQSKFTVELLAYEQWSGGK